MPRALAILALGLLLPLGGCVTKAKAKAQARAAYLAGQQDAMARMQQQTAVQGPSISVRGPVRNPVIQWKEGLTLRQAIVDAGYEGASDPISIYVLHNNVTTRVDVNRVLNGEDVPLQPGDVVTLVQFPTLPLRPQNP